MVRRFFILTEKSFSPSITAHFSRSEPSLFISHDARRDEGRRVFILFFFIIFFFLSAATAASEVPLVELFAGIIRSQRKDTEGDVL